MTSTMSLLSLIHICSNSFSKIYHLDKVLNQEITLSSLFASGFDYASVIDANIKQQMRDRMAQDDSLYYFIDDEEGIEFSGIKREQNFYIDSPVSYTHLDTGTRLETQP